MYTVDEASVHWTACEGSFTFLPISKIRYFVNQSCILILTARITTPRVRKPCFALNAHVGEIEHHARH